MTRLAAAAAVLVALAACQADGSTQPRTSTEADTAEDVRYLVARLEDVHPNPYHSVSRGEFRTAAERLREKAPILARNEFLVELMRLLALLGERDGHSGIFPLDDTHEQPVHLYPIRLYDFSDGLFVVGAVGDRDLMGARLDAIEGVRVETIRRAVAPLVPRDNELSLRARLPQYMLVAEILDGLGISNGVGPAVFTFTLANGDPRDVRLAPVDAFTYSSAFPDLYHPMVVQGLPQRRRPAYVARRNDDRWLMTLRNGRVVHAAYNVTLGDTTDFADDILRRARSPHVEQLIVDVRHNSGGDNGTYAPLLDALRNRTIDRPGRLVVLIGRTTFSAAANFVTELERSSDAVFVGEPSGGSPNLYGDPVPVSLPASGWTAHVAGLYWEKSTRADSRLAIEPDVTVELSSADFFSGRDPVLTAALNLNTR